MINSKIILSSLLAAAAFTMQHCVTVPERIPTESILNSPKLAELRPLEKEIVQLNYEIRDQKNRETEFRLAYENEKKTSDALRGDEKKMRQPVVDKAKLKYEIESEKHKRLQLKLRERIALLEFKKANILSLDSTGDSKTPVEVSSYEKYHKTAEERVSDIDKKIQKMESDYKAMPSMEENK